MSSNVKAHRGGARPRAAQPEISASAFDRLLAWIDRLPDKRDDEAGLVEFAWQPQATSRLACQITLTDALDGLVLHVPARQL